MNTTTNITTDPLLRLYGYYPSMDLAIVALVLYACVIITVTGLTIRFRWNGFYVLCGAGAGTFR